jgi:ribose-phosphate pyrophosphokinase
MIFPFYDRCLEVQLQANCRQGEHLVELLLMLDAARGASASRITAVIPHYAYVQKSQIV